ncbi:chemotaxis response regulator protein-glutamate methylesterase [Sphaerotilus natans]|nr:chemotaxis response regulator protein-glutamate methylesterase [Sphaerotilus natans]
MRGLMSGIIARQADMECVGAACDALQAREMIRELDPDVITLDMAMPKMDGLDFLERLMRLRPTPTIMVTSAAQRQPDIVTRALALGAAAVIDKAAVGVPGAFEAFERELLAALRQAVQSRPAAPRRSVPAAPATVSSPALSVASPAPLQAPTSAAPVLSGGPAVEIGERRIRLIAIGASTGGPEATPHVIRALSAQVPPVVIVQHIPGGFSARYAARLDTLGALRVCEARDEMVLQQGHGYVAPGGRHLSVVKVGASLVARVTDTEPVNRHRPSVDVLFRSVAQVVGERALGVMLTGMGGDGAEGMRRMRDAGAWNIAQDEATSAIFGMPKEAIRAGACQEVLALQAIGPRLMAMLGLVGSGTAGALRSETSTAGR